MSGKTILTKKQFQQKSKSKCIHLHPSNKLMIYFYQSQYGKYLVTISLFDDDGHELVSGTSTIQYTLDQAYDKYMTIFNLQ